jgi:error-prone DNA polymerase
LSLTLLAATPTGYANLSQLITKARLRSAKGEALATWDDLAAHRTGLIALSGGRQGAVAQHLLAGRFDAAQDVAQHLCEIFGPEYFFVELQRQGRPGDEWLSQALLALAERIGLRVVATNDVHYATRDGYRLHDVLVSIRHLTTLETSHHQRRGNSEAYLKSAAEMARLFADRPDALAATCEIANRCNVILHHGVQDLPTFPLPPAFGGDVLAYLRALCQAMLTRRFATKPSDRTRMMLAHELTLIGQLGLANYFLIVWDIMRFARSQGIRCQGRGSAANSLVAYLLEITPIDPLAHDLVFERFLSEERPGLPDIDIDFDALRREEVIQYVYQRYGRDHAAMACTFVTFQPRSAIHDVGRSLDLSSDQIETEMRKCEIAEMRDCEIAGIHNSAIPQSRISAFPQLLQEIQGLPRHLGIHNGGMVLSEKPLAEIVPLEPATMAGRTVCQWDKDALEDAGMVKIDLLGLRMLSALEEALDVIEETGGQRPELDRLTFDDPAVYDMICAGDTIGCFQVESRAQAQLIPHFRPRCFEDLIVEISLIRPGPIQGNMVQPYLRRRQGKEPVTYLHPLLEPALAETLGVIVFQEQVLKVARDLAGFTPGQGEVLRRALGHKDGEAALEKLREAFIMGATSRGVPSDVAVASFEQLRAFGGYAFAKSHAASFAVIVYQSAWLKRYHPLAFYIGLLRCQPMGFYSPAVLVNDAKRHGLAVLPVEVNRSGVRYEAENGTIRIGLSEVNRLGQQGAERIVLARLSPFTSLADFCRRTRLPRSLVENLILAGAFDSLLHPPLSTLYPPLSTLHSPPSTHRRELLWQLGLFDYEEDSLLLDQVEAQVEADRVPAELPLLPPLEALALELKTVGVSAGEHRMAHYRAVLARQGVLSSRDLPGRRDGEMVWVAGQVTVIQSPPTAKGFWFLTLEDEFGMINIVVAPPVVAQYRQLWRSSPLLAIWGRIQREGAVVTLLGQRPWRLASK